MEPDDLLARHGEQAERISVAQVRLDREREFCEVGEVAEVVGVDAVRVEGGAVVKDFLVDAPQGPRLPLALP
jgi:hypothetical protein